MNGTMPAGTSSRVGSSAMSDADGTTRCPRSSKKSASGGEFQPTPSVVLVPLCRAVRSPPVFSCSLSDARRPPRGARVPRYRAAAAGGRAAGVPAPLSPQAERPREAVPRGPPFPSVRPPRIGGTRAPAARARSAACAASELLGLEPAGAWGVHLGGGPHAGGGAGGEPESAAEHACDQSSVRRLRRPRRAAGTVRPTTTPPAADSWGTLGGPDASLRPSARRTP